MRASPWLVAVVVALVAGPAAAKPVPPQHGQQAPRPPPPPKVIKDPPPPPVVGLTRIGELRPTRGYVDDEVVVDGGALIALVRDGVDVRATRITIADGTVAGEVAIGAVAPEPHHVIPVGDRLLVVHGVETPRAATLVDGAGKRVRAWKPAEAISLRMIKGKPTLVAHTATARGKATVHQVALYDLATGKRLPKKGAPLTLGPDGRDAKLDFTPTYFLDDLTLAVGVRGGVFRKAQNQRSPDTWASYDLVTGTWVADQPITDPMGLARSQPILAAHTGEREFVRMADDLSALELWRDGASTELALDQALVLYDPTSVQYARRGDTLWLSLTVDPTNPPAVKRQKVDARYLDLFEVQGDRAVRRARLLVDKPGVRWGWAGDVWWALEKRVGISRGGPIMTMYRL
ncbi:MAG: hypothetical protein IPL61_34540 [Myxococcales bacterium]|nr:hypothetical protein [Myxococcales bacterium]